MGSFIIRRLVQAVFTILGVMLLTFVLFRLVAGDVSAQFVNPKLGKEQRVAWLKKRHLDLPMVLNFQRHLVITDKSKGKGKFAVRDAEGSKVATAMMLEQQEDETIVSLPVQWLSGETPLIELTQGDPWVERPKAQKETPTTQPTTTSAPSSRPAEHAKPMLIFSLHDGSELTIDLSPFSGKAVKKRKEIGRASCRERV